MITLAACGVFIFGFTLGSFFVLGINAWSDARRERLQSERQHRDWLRKVHEDAVGHIKATGERANSGARTTQHRFKP